MPRRYTPEKREIELDLRYNSQLVTMFINRLMRDGKKSTAESVLYDAFDIIEERAKRPAIRSSSRRWTMPRRASKSAHVVWAAPPIGAGGGAAGPPDERRRWLLMAARNRGVARCPVSRPS